MIDQKYIPAIGLTLSGVIYFWFAYFIGDRADFPIIIASFLILFLLYFALLRFSREHSLRPYLIAGIIYRMTFLFAVPVLSDDYFRFIWDGLLLTGGENPYVVSPASAGAGLDSYRRHLLDHMNSPAYFSVYPPVCQAIFAIAAWASPGDITGSLFVMHLFIFTAEVGTIFLLKAIAERYALPGKVILLYVLNPLVITELSGNLHFEGIMIFFLLAAIYMLLLERHLLSAMLMSLAVATKLIPLLFLPLLWRRLGASNSLRYYSVTGILAVILFLPFASAGMIEGFTSGMELYFQRFEFNASIYYVLRWIGYQLVGYNVITVNGAILSMLTIMGVLYYVVKERQPSINNIADAMMFVLMLYFLLALVVHPWYVTTLVALTTLTVRRYAIVWSVLIPFTYMAYATEKYTENLWIVAAEYILLVLYLAYEWRRKSGWRFLTVVSGRA